MSDVLGVPRWRQFKIFPVNNVLQKQGNDDKAYAFDWEEGRQYSWENVCDPAFALRGGVGHEIKMVHESGRLDLMAASRGAGEAGDKCDKSQTLYQSHWSEEVRIPSIGESQLMSQLI
jgi:hypothetical protein